MKKTILKLITTEEELERDYVKAKDLYSDWIDPQFKQQILKEKKKCLFTIITDTITSILVLAMICTFLYILFMPLNSYSNVETKSIITITCAIIIYIFAGILISIPKRIHNYRNFNFERTCYARIINTYTRHTHGFPGIRFHIYYADVQINGNKYVKEVYVGRKNHRNLNNGDIVIIFSFDGYKKHLIIPNKY